MTLAALLARHVGEVNARLIDEGRCVMHNSDVSRQAEHVALLANGNAVPLCGDCWTLWRNDGPDVVACLAL